MFYIFIACILIKKSLFLNKPTKQDNIMKDPEENKITAKINKNHSKIIILSY